MRHKIQESSHRPGILEFGWGPVKKKSRCRCLRFCNNFSDLFRLDGLMSIPMQSYESVYRKHRDAVMRFAIQCVGNRGIAEELTAEAFLELHRHWESIDTERLPSWLFTVVKNRAADHWRRAELERRYFASEPPRSQQAHAPIAGHGLFDTEALKPVHRICLTLRYAHEMSLSEIAARLGLSEVQVKGHLQYARELLRKQLSGKGR
jgi:RNA polymerase sigma-70 factor (ECF subfamily)